MMFHFVLIIILLVTNNFPILCTGLTESVKNSIDMCYNPLKIVNNSKGGFRNMSLKRVVPCGQCEECLSRYKNEYYLRCYFQYEETIKNGGCVPFITLTYNDYNLPFYKDKEWNYKTPCFDKWHIQRFIKYVRRYCVNELDWTKEEANDINYIFCSEFGKDPTRTMRSHYHGFLFLPISIDVPTLNAMLRYSWSITKYVADNKGKKHRKHYALGFHSFGKYGAFVTSPAALKYAMKYVGKDVNGSQDIHGIREYCQADPANYEKIKRYLPFHLQGRGFGLYGLKVLTREDYISRKYIDPLPSPNKGEVSYLPIPSYLRHHHYFAKPDGKYKNYGFFVHKQNYYDDLKEQLRSDLERDILTFRENMSNRSAVFSQSSEEDVQELESLYNKIIPDEYPIFSKLVTYPMPEETNHNLFDLWYDIEKSKAECNDAIVRMFNLNEPLIKAKPFVFEMLPQVRNYFELDPLTPEELQLATYNMLQSQTYGDYPFITRIYNPAYCNTKSSYLDKHPDIKDSIKKRMLWRKYFPDLYVFHELYTKLLNANKQYQAERRKAEWLSQKECRDFHNNLNYN